MSLPFSAYEKIGRKRQEIGKVEFTVLRGGNTTPPLKFAGMKCTESSICMSNYAWFLGNLEINALKLCGVCSSHRLCTLRGMLVMCLDFCTLFSRFRSTKFAPLFPLPTYLSGLSLLSRLSLSPLFSVIFTVFHSQDNHRLQTSTTKLVRSRVQFKSGTPQLNPLIFFPSDGIPPTSSRYSIWPHHPLVECVEQSIHIWITYSLSFHILYLYILLLSHSPSFLLFLLL